ncbi:Pentatricopeptide repeat-containing protein At3g09060 [Linum perenne]
MNAMVKGGDLVAACQVFDEMFEIGVVPSGMCCNIMIDGLFKSGDYGRAKGFLENRMVEDAMSVWEILHKYCEPNCMTCGILIRGLCKNDLLGKALKVLAEG